MSVLVVDVGTSGVRAATVERWPAARDMDEVRVGDVPVRIKVSP